LTTAEPLASERGDKVTGFGRFDGVAAADLVKFEQVKRTSG
jgi:hypothetical protein